MKKLIILALIIVSGKMAAAQNFYTANTVDSTYYYQNVKNTGNDVVQFGIFNLDMKAMVWDGNQPSFYWRLDTINNSVKYSGVLPIDPNSITNQSVEDPDVVLSESGHRALITYVNNGEIYICSKIFNSITNKYEHLHGPFLIGSGANPNVDVAHKSINETCVITWEYNNSIYTKTCNIEALDTTTTLIVKKSYGDPRYHRPDVAVYYREIQNDTVVVVSYVYASEKPNGNWSFGVVQFFLDTLIDIAKSPYDILSYPDNIPSPGSFDNDIHIGTPRIAAPAALQHIFDFSVAVDYWKAKDNDTVWGIWNFTCFNGNLYTKHLINSTALQIYLYPNFPTTPYYNRKPVITYGGDFIHVCWEYFDAPGEINAGYWHVIKILLDLTGTPVSNYSVVNYNTNSNHCIPSISGRFSVFYDIFYTFYDSDNRLISCKSSNSSNQNLRKRNITPEIEVFPNPVYDKIFFLSDTVLKLQSVIIFDVQGKVVLQKNQFETENSIDLTDLPSGIYILKIVDKGITKTKKIYKN